jgi:hypothetical protein
VVPSEFTQLAMVFAREMSFAVSVVAFAGSSADGAAPVVESASVSAVCMALLRPATLVAEEPTLMIEEANGARAQAAATVVTSLIEMLAIDPSELQLPSAATSARAALLVPGERPGFPPVAVMYICALGEGQA